MFDNGNGWPVIFGHQLKRGIGIINVIIAERFTLNKLSGHHAMPWGALCHAV